jgi:hypothetical protein
MRTWLRDCDGIFGSEFGKQVAHLGMEKVLSIPRLSTAQFHLDYRPNPDAGITNMSATSGN